VSAVVQAPRVPFRFNATNHTYVDLATGELLPHITGMLTRAGWVDDLWMTEESSERGRIVHSLTADYDLGAIEDPRSVVSVHKAYLLAHVAAMKVLGLEVLSVEEPLVHPIHYFGGRPDRAVDDAGEKGPLEIKSGEPAKSHPIQTALQAILLEQELLIPAEMQKRQCLYLRPNGRYKLEVHPDRSDIVTARGIIRACCGRL